MAASTSASGLRMATFGTRVIRATANLPQTAQGALFTVSGGLILVTSIIGRVTTVIQTQLNNTKLVANPTTGTDVDLCAVLDITADEVGCLYGITGVFSDALVGTNAGAAPVPQRPVAVNSGTIDLNCSASNTGQVRWILTYVPLEDGAAAVAA